MFERRLGPRFSAHGEVQLELDGFRGQVTLLNISPGGFGVATSHLIAGAGPLEFRFSGAKGLWRMTFAARLAYIRVQSTPAGTPDLYLAGFSFVAADAPDVAHRIASLIERVAASDEVRVSEASV